MTIGMVTSGQEDESSILLESPGAKSPTVQRLASQSVNSIQESQASRDTKNIDLNKLAHLTLF